MAIKQLNPYLNFDGTAGDAIKLYERVLGAKVESMQRFSDVPGPPPSPENAHRVIHAMLQIGPGVIMISDTMPGMPLVQGTNNYVLLDFDDVADMTAKFDGLAQGGKVGMALHDTFWGARFGIVTDRFGINWMFNCAVKKA